MDIRKLSVTCSVPSRAHRREIDVIVDITRRRRFQMDVGRPRSIVGIGLEKQLGVGSRYDTAAERFEHLVRMASAQAGQRAVILVDEYDKPILDALDAPEVARANRDFLALDGMVSTAELLSTFDVDDMPTEALLFQTGYLTIERPEPRPRGTAPVVLRRRCPTCADAGTHRCAADARRPSAAGGRRRGSSRRRPPSCRAANLRISPSISRGACWGNLPSTRTKATWYAKPNRLWGPRRRAISRRSASRKVASRIRRGRETSGSETGTALSGRNERSDRTLQQHGTQRVPWSITVRYNSRRCIPWTGRENRRLPEGLDRAAGRAQPAPRHPPSTRASTTSASTTSSRRPPPGRLPRSDAGSTSC